MNRDSFESLFFCLPLTYYQLIAIISIDSNRTLKEVSIIKINSCSSSRKDVKLFLEELKNILNSDTFDIDKNLLIIKSKKDEIEFSTNYTILDLEYNSMDIVERLKELTISEYSETLYDRDDDNPPKLFVFGKDIN